MPRSSYQSSDRDSLDILNDLSFPLYCTTGDRIELRHALTVVFVCLPNMTARRAIIAMINAALGDATHTRSSTITSSTVPSPQRSHVRDFALEFPFRRHSLSDRPSFGNMTANHTTTSTLQYPLPVALPSRISRAVHWNLWRRDG